MPQWSRLKAVGKFPLFSRIQQRRYSPWAIALGMLVITVGTFYIGEPFRESVFILFGAPVIYATLVYGLPIGGGVAAAAAVVHTALNGASILFQGDVFSFAGANTVLTAFFMPYFYLLFCLVLGRLIINEKEAKAKYQDLSEELAKSAGELVLANRETTALFTSTIQALAAAIDAKDPYTRGHSERVTKYAMEVAAAMGLSEEERKKLFYAATLHDIGKIGVQEIILKKPGKLTNVEWMEVARHPEVGANIINSIKPLKEVIPLIYHHHEWYNGAGYPDGITGEDIPLGARIIAVVDAYDAMTSDRPYRLAHDTNKAVKELKTGKGVQFDPEIVSVFLKLLSRLGTMPMQLSQQHFRDEA